MKKPALLESFSDRSRVFDFVNRPAAGAKPGEGGQLRGGTRER